MALQPFVGPWPLSQFRNLFFFTDGITPWTSELKKSIGLKAQNTFPFFENLDNNTDFDREYSFFHSFINGSTALLLGPGLIFSSVIFFTQTVGLLGQGTSPSQGRYLHTGQHKHRINAYRHPFLECGSNPRSTVRVSEDISCLRPRG
jgi:hypothetical protein